jgi:hypothetical protein
MITIEDLLLPDPRWREYASMPEMDPLTEDDALQEAQLLDIRFDSLRSTAGLLFELRTALQLREANTGVLILRGVRSLKWTSGPRETERTAWTVGGSVVTSTDRLFGLELGLWPAPGAQLTLGAESAAFFAGDVPGLDRIPDYLDDDEPTIRAQLASWRSAFMLVSAVFLDRSPRAS